MKRKKRKNQIYYRRKFLKFKIDLECCKCCVRVIEKRMHVPSYILVKIRNTKNKSKFYKIPNEKNRTQAKNQKLD